MARRALDRLAFPWSRRRLGLAAIVDVALGASALFVWLAASSANPVDRSPRRSSPAAAFPRARVARLASDRLAPGSDPRVLPGNIMVADRGNDRLVEITPRGKVAWRFPRPGDLSRGTTFRVPDDAFFSPGGTRVIATQEDNFVVSVIDRSRHRLVYRYGRAGIAGTAANRLHNPDDAFLLRGGAILTADIKNCRLLVLRPPAHRAARQLGTPGSCVHAPPASFASPNGAFPARRGRLVVTEIGGNWVDVLDRRGHLLSTVHPPGFTYPSDTTELRPGVFLSADYAKPGAIEAFSASGRLLWRFAPRGPGALNKPSIALGLPNGDVIATDDHNHRVIVIDPRRHKIVWQYGHRRRPGRRVGFLDTPDGVDLAPPHQLIRRAGRITTPIWPTAP